MGSRRTKVSSQASILGEGVWVRTIIKLQISNVEFSICPPHPGPPPPGEGERSAYWVNGAFQLQSPVSFRTRFAAVTDRRTGHLICLARSISARRRSRSPGEPVKMSAGNLQ